MGPVYDKETESWRILTNREIYVMVKRPTIAETVRLNRLCWFGHVQRTEENGIPPHHPKKNFIYEFGNNKAERQTEKQMARRSEGGWKTSWWNRVEGMST